jgi:hypothetical protein
MKKDEMKERESEAAPIIESRSGGITMPANVLRCQCCDAPVPGAVCGKKSPCPSCGYPYPIGDCSDLAEN